jgi:TetR/AcrR family transcriptional regulator, fatty acid metabolism regulator protein
VALSQSQANLVRVAYRLIGERGAHRVSLEEIAAAAGVSKSLVLYHFKSRENLVLATMEWVLIEVAARIRGAVTAAPTPAGKVESMVDVIFAGAEANRRFYLTYLDLVEHAARMPRFGRVSTDFRGIVDTAYAAIVEAGVARGEFAVADVDEAASVLRALVDGLFLQWLQEEDWAGRHDAYRAVCKRALLTYLRPAGQRQAPNTANAGCTD